MKDEEEEQPTNQQMHLERMLTNWLTAVTLFHYQYTQINQFLQDAAVHQTLPAVSKSWIGQCPASQLKSLLTTMHVQLEKMLSEANQFDPMVPAQNYEKLAIHIQLLDKLNHQAKTLLQLASLTAS